MTMLAKDLPTKLTLIGFSHGPPSAMRFREYYADHRRVVYMYIAGKWLFNEYDMSQHASALNTLRESNLVETYNSKYPSRLMIATSLVVPGLSHCILPDHITIIASYLEAIMSCPIPVPAENVRDVAKNHINLNGFHCVCDDPDNERWHIPSVDDVVECEIHEDGDYTWSQDCGDSLQECSLFYNIMFTTLRVQILGLPLR